MHLCVAFQSLIPVCATLGQEKHPAVFRRQYDCVPLAVSRRIASDIEHNVEHSSPGATNQLGLESGLDLIVHPANGAFLDAKAHVRLDRLEMNALIREFLGAPGAKKVASVVLTGSGIDNPSACYLSLAKDHLTGSLVRKPAKIVGRQTSYRYHDPEID